ncbi:MAG: radical SAM protein [Firmicutes bacterium]|jgi:radical SAM superfamily enzyme YgiQ (UPF0313 family)|nr:radical SAM protein [Bacillota bacterium]
MNSCEQEYTGFEVGGIRPPSEADSLLLRLTRNCPWNRCKFCSLYKGMKFSLRLKEHIIKDIDFVKDCVDTFKSMEKSSQNEAQELLSSLKERYTLDDNWVLQFVFRWYKGGMKSIFLQDANSMIIKPDDMVEILLHLRKCFGNVERITSYGRSHTIARISDEDMKGISQAGLNRIHIGMETGSDKVLKLVEKGVDKKTHIIAGQKVKKAGIELSEYFMPGLGGNEYSEENARETADALNQINPDFIRLRTLAVTNRSVLKNDYDSGIFTRTNDDTMVMELKLLIESFNGITSYIKSDHILNLIPEVEGRLPEDKEIILSKINWYLDLSDEEKIKYKVGRRIGAIQCNDDLYDKDRIRRIDEFIEKHSVDESNIDYIMDRLMNRFI